MSLSSWEEAECNVDFLVFRDILISNTLTDLFWRQFRNELQAFSLMDDEFKKTVEDEEKFEIAIKATVFSFCYRNHLTRSKSDDAIFL